MPKSAIPINERQDNKYIPSSAIPIQEKEKSFLGKVAGTAGRILDIPSNIIGGGIKAAKEIGEGTYQAPQIAKFNMPTVRGQRQIDVGEFINPAIVGAVRGVKQRQTVMEELPKAVGVEPESTAGIGLGLIGEIATPDVGDIFLASKLGRKLTGKITEGAGKLIGKTGEKIAEAGVKPTKTQRKEFLIAAKKTIGKYIADENLAGNVAENLTNKIDELQSAYDDIAIKSGKQVTLKDWLTSYQKAIDNLDIVIDKKDINALNKFREELGTVIDKAGGISLEDLVKKRRILDKKIPTSQWMRLLGGESVNQNVVKRMFLQNVINETGGKKLKALGQKLKPLYKLANIVDLQTGVSVGGRIGGLGDIAAATGGMMTGKMINAVLGVLARRAIASPRSLGEIAKGLIKGGESLKEPGLLSKIAKSSIRLGKEGTISEIRNQTQEFQ